MNDIRSGKFYALMFVLFVLFLGIGGFFLTKYLIADPKSPNNANEVIADNSNLKLNKEKDYIYFTNDDLKNKDYNINYHDVKLNFNTTDAQELEKTLNTEMSVLKDTYILIEDKDLSPEELEKVIYSDSGIYEASYNKYTRYISSDYASLLKESYAFNCFEGETYLKSMAYTFNIETGKLLSNNELLAAFNLSLDKVKDLVKTRLLDKQSLIPNPDNELEGDLPENPTASANEPSEDIASDNDSSSDKTSLIEKIDIEATLKTLDDSYNYVLYVDKSGYLTLSYLVKTREIDYNDVIVLK